MKSKPEISRFCNSALLTRVAVYVIGVPIRNYYRPLLIAEIQSEGLHPRSKPYPSTVTISIDITELISARIVEHVFISYKRAVSKSI